jgi:hypothetical protein
MEALKIKKTKSETSLSLASRGYDGMRKYKNGDEVFSFILKTPYVCSFARTR